jgi:hypothetical protein
VAPVLAERGPEEILVNVAPAFVEGAFPSAIRITAMKIPP